MSNLNDQNEEPGYGREHERSEGRIPSGDGSSLEDGDHSDRSDPSDAAPERGGADVTRVGDDGPPDAPGDGSDGPGYQPELPGFQAVARSGPLPDPGEFAAYGYTVPDAPERILRVFERNAQVSADAIERGSKSQASTMQIFSIGYVVLPLAVLIAGVILAAMGTAGGTITAVLGGVGVVAEMFARALGSRRTPREDESRDE